MEQHSSSKRRKSWPTQPQKENMKEGYEVVYSHHFQQCRASTLLDSTPAERILSAFYHLRLFSLLQKIPLHMKRWMLASEALDGTNTWRSLQGEGPNQEQGQQEETNTIRDTKGRGFDSSIFRFITYLERLI